ncbi:MAG TPA: histidine kinase [Ideonella sp.]|nr:histidine kinase [Ideonella sp.]
MPTYDLLRRSWKSWVSSDLDRVGPYWLQLVWTGLFAAAVALLFTLIGFVLHARGKDWTDLDNWAHWYGLNLFVSAFISYLVHALFEVLIRLIGVGRLRAWPAWRRNLFFSVVPLLGVAIGWPLAVSLLGFRLTLFAGGASTTNVNLGMLLFVLMFSALLNLYFTGQANTQAAERRATEARLKLLQGQIEPHFLFNTLANVVSLIDADPHRARLMLESFIDYLRSSLGGLRRDDHTLGQELVLIEAYLRVIGLRMDERLQWDIDVPDALRSQPLPALLLQPLVENAVQHGLEPKVEGGRLKLQARAEGQRLLLRVSDDGLGLRAAPQAARAGSGTALANIRERLQQAFGRDASLQLSEPAGGGVEALLTLPLAPQPPCA